MISHQSPGLITQNHTILPCHSPVGVTLRLTCTSLAQARYACDIAPITGAHHTKPHNAIIPFAGCHHIFFTCNSPATARISRASAPIIGAHHTKPHNTIMPFAGWHHIFFTCTSSAQAHISNSSSNHSANHIADRWHRIHPFVHSSACLAHHGPCGPCPRRSQILPSRR